MEIPENVYDPKGTLQLLTVYVKKPGSVDVLLKGLPHAQHLGWKERRRFIWTNMKAKPSDLLLHNARIPIQEQLIKPTGRGAQPTESNRVFYTLKKPFKFTFELRVVPTSFTMNVQKENGVVRHDLE